MLLNFLDPKLAPKVTCNCPVTENYEAENLISEDYTKKTRGFIAYPSIKPPIDIIFEFICPVNIHYIMIDTTVGNQRCTGVELLARSDAKSEFISLSKAVYDKKKNGVFFCNSRMFSSDNLPLRCDLNTYYLTYFKSNTFRTFLNTTELKLVIFRTEKSVPCLKRVEIHGKPAKTCSMNTVRTVYHIIHKPNIVVNTNKEFSIPEDFKDELTYELMSLPMTLPSGKTIDQSTLSRHNAEEVSLGRQPCDPFTGVKFNDKLKPILNVGLKSRIDMFVLQNSSKVEANNTICYNVLGRSSRKINNRNHEPEDELDKVITKAKEDPSFHSFTKKTCLKCTKHHQSLYFIKTCGHLFCRTCLLTFCDDSHCVGCNKQFEKKDIEKNDMC